MGTKTVEVTSRRVDKQTRYETEPLCYLPCYEARMLGDGSPLLFTSAGQPRQKMHLQAS